MIEIERKPLNFNELPLCFEHHSWASDECNGCWCKYDCIIERVV